MKGKAASLTLGAGLTLLFAGTAIADREGPNRNALLKGTYRFSMNFSCVQSDQGYSPAPDFFALGFGERGHDFVTGVITYDGNGRATETARGIFVFPGPFFPPNPEFGFPGSLTIATYTNNCSYDYLVNHDLSFVQEGSCEGEVLAGAGHGQKTTASGLRFVGQIGVGGQVLITNQIDAAEITLDVGDPAPGGFHTKRFCGAAGTAVRIHRP